MAAAFRVVVSAAAEREQESTVEFVRVNYGFTYAERLDERLTEAISSLASMTARHTRMLALLDRRYVYRRVLLGAHRVIFTIDAATRTVEVVRVDLQSSDPVLLDDLP